MAFNHWEPPEHIESCGHRRENSLFETLRSIDIHSVGMFSSPKNGSRMQEFEINNERLVANDRNTHYKT
jgi:hypothetical protein